ncbi:MAG: pyridoxine 5'-phosphate synthase [Gammaproteobacteria bacterium]|nr:pyridoxine 5'-phosphate synthase [Gammaproteobacteria bacterium]|tara:strand:+ start:3181 stop:3957 length:777 start_codon:yes stop_codon:yes gene_type:complete
MSVLSVNVNKIALLRNSRGTNYPDLLHFVRKILGHGIKGITVHPRPDERHITRQDARDIAALLQAHPDVEFNVEGYPSADFMALIDELRPAQCTLVPDEPGQLTSDHGWQIASSRRLLDDVLPQLRQWNVRSSLFLDPDPAAAELAADVGTDRIELYTEHYAQTFAAADGQQTQSVLATYFATADRAMACGLGVNAGHDLNLRNLAMFLSGGQVLEVSIGHALIVESLELGMDEVLRRYQAIMAAAPQSGADDASRGA